MGHGHSHFARAGHREELCRGTFAQIFDFCANFGPKMTVMMQGRPLPSYKWSYNPCLVGWNNPSYPCICGHFNSIYSWIRGPTCGRVGKYFMKWFFVWEFFMWVLPRKKLRPRHGKWWDRKTSLTFWDGPFSGDMLIFLGGHPSPSLEFSEDWVNLPLRSDPFLNTTMFHLTMILLRKCNHPHVVI